MNHRTLSFFFASLLTSLASAQSPSLNWEQWYTVTSGEAIGEHLVLGPDTDLYALGNDESVNAHLIRYRAYDGLQVWVTPIDSTTATVDIVKRNDGVLITATTHYGFSQGTGTDVRVTAYSPAGTELWQFTYNDSLNYDDEPTDLHVDAAGNIHVCAFTEELPGNPSQYSNITTIKLDPNGNLLWRRTFVHATPVDDSEPHSIDTDPMGNVYVGGFVTNMQPEWEDMVLLKYDLNGTLLWQWTFNRNNGFGTHVDRVEHVFADATGCIVAGTTESQDDLNGEDLTVLRLSGVGAPVWTRNIDVGDDQFLEDAEQDAFGNTLIVGNVLTTQGYKEAVAKVAPVGALLWTTLTPITSTASHNRLSLDGEGNAYTSGTTGQSNLSDGYVQFYTADGVSGWTYFYQAAGTLDDEDANNVAIGDNGAIYMTGQIIPTGVSIAHAFIICLCTPETGICLGPVQQQAANANGRDMMDTDLNGDGWRDLVVRVQGQPALAVFMGGPSGFNAASNVSLPFIPTGEGSFGDLDQDGDMDLVITEPNPADEVAIVLNQNGTLQFSAMLPTGTSSATHAIGDIDGQNGNDIVVLRWDPPYISVKLNNGSGAFTNGTATGLGAPDRVVLEDGDGDGDLDILAGRNNQPDVYILWGNGNGSFSAPTQFNSMLSDPSWANWTDLDDDGTLDIVCYSEGGPWSWLKGLGGTSYAPAIFDYSTPVVVDMEIIPSDMDSISRFAVGLTNGVSLLNFNDCNRQLEQQPLSVLPGWSHEVSVADWNNDGTLDVLAYSNQGNILLWSNCDSAGIMTDVPVVEAIGTAVLHPNPATDRITITPSLPFTGPVQWSIHDATGRLLRSGSFGTAVNGSVGLKGLESGTYLLEWTDGTGRRTARFIKQ